jgi:hypothetical protein
MRSQRCGIVFFIALLVQVLDWPLSNDPANAHERIKLTASNAVMFVGEVVAVDSDEPVSAVTIRVKNILCGSAASPGQEFRLGTANTWADLVHIEDADRKHVVPRLKKGETHLWLCFCGDGQATICRSQNLEFIWPIPTTGAAEFPAAERLGKAIASVDAQATEAKALERLRELAVDEVPEVGAWAIRTLRDFALYYHDDATRDFLRELMSTEKLSITAQMALDKTLLAVDYDRWRTSPEREPLYLHWVRDVEHPREAERVARRLSTIAQHPKLEGFETPDPILRLVDAAIHNQHVSVELRAGHISTLSGVPRRYENSGPAFDWLVALLTHTTVHEFRINAARVLAHYPLDARRKSRLVKAALGLNDVDAFRMLEPAISDMPTAVPAP